MRVNITGEEIAKFPVSGTYQGPDYLCAILICIVVKTKFIFYKNIWLHLQGRINPVTYYFKNIFITALQNNSEPITVWPEIKVF